MKQKTFYITTPIFYPNAKPHIGHAYTDVAADVLARFHRLDGKEVFFASGTDEHGLKMQKNAEQEGISPQELADKNSTIFRSLLDSLDCSYDVFIRTTQASHYEASQTFWNKMLESGDIYFSRYEGWYSVRQETYFDEKEIIEGEDGLKREPLGSVVEWQEEETFFFRLSAYQEKLLEYYQKHSDFILPLERRNEVIRFVESGLKDLSISRSTFSWGIPVPNDPKQILYVWVDALSSYLTAIGFPKNMNSFAHFWPATHIIGKDILRFHAVYWPAFLMSAGLPLPERIFAHGFLFNRGEKMSKSVGNVVDPFSLIATYGVDSLRYFFMREISFGQDGSYNHTAIVNRMNADLANDLGNLVQRCLSMIVKFCAKRIPPFGLFTKKDQELFDLSVSSFSLIGSFMKEQAMHHALNQLFYLINQTNRYFAEEKPWSLHAIDVDRMHTVLYTTAEIIRRIGLMSQPFMPHSSNLLLNFLSIPQNERLFSFLQERLKPEQEIQDPYPIFPRYVEKEEQCDVD